MQFQTLDLRSLVLYRFADIVPISPKSEHCHVTSTTLQLPHTKCRYQSHRIGVTSRSSLIDDLRSISIAINIDTHRCSLAFWFPRNFQTNRHSAFHAPYTETDQLYTILYSILPYRTLYDTLLVILIKSPRELFTFYINNIVNNIFPSISTKHMLKNNYYLYAKHKHEPPFRIA